MSLFTVVALLTASCVTEHPANPPCALFAKIDLGMRRSDVEAHLGAAVSPASSPTDEVWYLSPPPIQPYDSPFAPGGIGIRFTADGHVGSTRLNPQWLIPGSACTENPCDCG
jgi:hypothetical protein